jgi:NAD(P)-dependent dehydrogenase (short-subunit alcohol dehydrogenase family)
MDLELAGKRVLVAGGSKGIGLACARLFQAEGARVAIASRSADNLARAAETLPGVMCRSADLTDADQARDLVEAIEAELGPVDILVNSAGAARRTPPDDLTPAHWLTALQAKFLTYIHVIDPLVKRMAARGHGVIVNVVGQGGKVASPVHLPGGSANAALMLATAGLAQAYAPRGVRVVGLNPGTTDTDRVAQGLKADAALQKIEPEEALRRLIARIPVGRIARSEEVANAVVFLASARASYLTGVTISMDGALTATVV